MNISIIAAIGQNNVIGYKNSLPWDLPADMEYFREKTKDRPVIMGSKTFKAIGKALPKRTNIVLSTNKNFKAPGCIIVRSIKEALDIAVKENKEIMIIGGTLIYKEFLPLANKMYLTLIDASFPGDTYFPEYNTDKWKEVRRVDHSPDKKNHYYYSFVTLEKKP